MDPSGYAQCAYGLTYGTSGCGGLYADDYISPVPSAGPTLSDTIATGTTYADNGQYIGGAIGCGLGALVGSAYLITAAAGCAAGLEIGTPAGYVAGGSFGLIVGAF